MTTTTLPSRFAEQLLTLVVRDGELRESMIGDLREECAKYARRAGVAKAARWHLRQGVGIAVRYGLMRMLRRKPPVRWISLADAEPEGPWWSGLTRDVLYARRAIVQRPLLSFTVVLTLALALAANSTTFSLMDALVLRPYRFAGVDRLSSPRRRLRTPTSSIGSTSRPRISVNGANSRAPSRTGRCTSGGTPTCPVSTSPSRCRHFSCRPDSSSCWARRRSSAAPSSAGEAQPGQHHRVVLGHGLWARRFASDPNIVGTSVRLDGEPYEVVGVAPAGFSTPDGAELWAPIALTDQQWADRRNESFGIYRPAGGWRDRRTGARRAHDDRRHPAP